MADITIDATVKAGVGIRAQRGMVWTTPSIGYQFGVDSDDLGKYWKTTDKGVNWSAGVTFSTAAKMCITVAVWYDKWTKSDAGTKIHIAWIDETDDECNYRTLDTSNDSLGTEFVVDSATGAVQNVGWSTRHVTICTAEAGDIHVGVGYNDDATFDGGHFSSDPSTISFSAADSSGALYENSALFQTDQVMFIPWNSGTTADILALYIDSSINNWTLKTFSASGSAWSEVGGGLHTDQNNYRSYDIMYRHSDDFFWVIASNTEGFGSSDHISYRHEDSTTIASTDVIVLNTATFSEASLLINQQNGDLYVAYMNGSTYDTAVKPVYQKSTNNGDTWGGEVAYGEAAEANYRGLWAGCSIGDAGGRFQPTFGQYTNSDLLTNNVNSVEIAAVAVSGRIMSSLVAAGGLAGLGGIAGKGGGLAG